MPVDTRSNTWEAVASLCHARILALTAELVAPGNSYEHTEQLDSERRGRIASLNEILSLANEEKP